MRACKSSRSATPIRFYRSCRLSHTFERTCGYYLTIMCGATVAYSRGIPQLAEDLQSIRPTMLISVPRIYERIWGAIRAKLDEGSPLRKEAVSGCGGRGLRAL